MWRADNYDAPDAPGSSLDGQPWWSSDLAHQVSVGDPDTTPVNHAAMAWEGWWSEIAQLGGPSPLIHFQDYPENRVDISRGHPGGLARFLAGSPTLLANLIRDDVARRPSHKAALRLVDHALELKHARGLETLELGIGLVEWTHEGVDYRGPLLMRPVRLRRRGADIEITLKRSRVRLNPGIQRAFADQLQVSLDAAAFVALTDDGGAFKPNPALDRLRDLTAHRGDVTVHARLVISSFGELSEPMLDDAKNLQHPILDALGGNDHAIQELRNSRVPVEIVHPDSKPADTDRSIVDSDSEQDAIVQNIVAGNSLVVRALPGTGATQTVVNALGALVSKHKRVLLVTPRTATSDAIKDRLAQVGLQGMAVELSKPARDIIASIGRNEKAKKPSLGQVDQAYERLRKVILKYREALAKKDATLGVSALECFTRLGTLSLRESPPETTARLDAEALEALSQGLGQAAELLRRAAELGEFKYGPADSPWYGVTFANVEDARKSQERARRLSSDAVPRLLEKFPPLLEQTPLPSVTTIGQMGVFVHLLMDMRDTLDRFQPSVFDRSLKDLITATGPKELAKTMPRLQRQRLKGLAKEHVRPGVSVPDLHESLVKIQSQRELWNRYVDTGHQPSVPAGLADVHVLVTQIEQDLQELDRVLGRTGKGERLADMPALQMLTLLEELAQESEILQSLERRREVQDHLEQMHLGPLVEDLATRHIEGDAVAAELELAWWRGALETILEKEEALLGSDKDVLVRLEADFRLVDEAHAGGNAQHLAWQLAERWSLGLMDWPEEAKDLKKILTNQTASVHSLTALAPHLTKALAPVWIATPYSVHRMPDSLRFDVVVVMDAGALSVAESVGALRRAPQVVAVGDPVSQTPTDFTLGVRDERENTAQDGDSRHEDSLYATLAPLVPTLSLTRSYRASGDELARVVNTAFYGGLQKTMPWAGSYLGHPSLVVDHLEDGHGMPDPQSGLVEGVDAEVNAVVDHVIDHVVTRPTESLMVLTASAKHASRVHEAVSVAAQTRSELASFMTSDSTEPFVVATLDQARGFTRDRVIFSLGYGRTPHGRVVSDLGPLSKEGGERLLAGVFTSARRHLRVLSCVALEDLRDERLSPTTRALGDVLHLLESPQLTPESNSEPDPLLVDLAKRLEAMGMSVELGYRGVIPLVAHYGGYCIALDTDQSLMSMPVREALRARPAALARSGWHYVRAFALELFTTPDAVAERIGVLVGAQTDAPSHSDGE
ncbi:MAG: AAA family ATPase [Pontimonas sp.]|nr:AAA family ATPase [Pontimonas sp.]